MTKKPFSVSRIAMCGWLLVWGFCVEGIAQGANPIAIAQKPEHTPKRISQELVGKHVIALGDPVFRVREFATEQLIAAGPIAIEDLLLALGSQDAEVVWRARVVLQEIVRSDKLALGVLENLAGSQKPHAAQLAKVMIQREETHQKQLSENRDPEQWFNKFIMSEKARSIERNLGID